MRERDPLVRWPLGRRPAGTAARAHDDARARSAPVGRVRAVAVLDLPRRSRTHRSAAPGPTSAAGIDELRDRCGRRAADLRIATACPRLLDGREGRLRRRGRRRRPPAQGGAWVLVNDDAYALEVGPLGPHRERRGFSTGLAVWLPDGLHEQLGAPGRHGRRGDDRAVEGVFLRADPADGGGITVRADTSRGPRPFRSPSRSRSTVPLIIAASAAALRRSLVGRGASARHDVCER
jgi:hypothetical protein